MGGIRTNFAAALQTTQPSLPASSGRTPTDPETDRALEAMSLTEAVEVQASGERRGRAATPDEMRTADLVSMHFARVNSRMAALCATGDAAPMEP